jgi:hypothetical protein
LKRRNFWLEANKEVFCLKETESFACKRVDERGRTRNNKIAKRKREMSSKKEKKKQKLEQEKVPIKWRKILNFV